MSTTNRIEAKHKMCKKYLNSRKRLGELFQIMKEMESKKILSFCNEIEKNN